MNQLQTIQTAIQTLKSDVYKKHHKKVIISTYRPSVKHVYREGTECAARV